MNHKIDAATMKAARGDKVCRIVLRLLKDGYVSEEEAVSMLSLQININIENATIDSGAVVSGGDVTQYSKD